MSAYHTSRGDLRGRPAGEWPGISRAPLSAWSDAGKRCLCSISLVACCPSSFPGYAAASSRCVGRFGRRGQKRAESVSHPASLPPSFLPDPPPPPPARRSRLPVAPCGSPWPADRAPWFSSSGVCHFPETPLTEAGNRPSPALSGLSEDNCHFNPTQTFLSPVRNAGRLPWHR